MVTTFRSVATRFDALDRLVLNDISHRLWANQPSAAPPVAPAFDPPVNLPFLTGKRLIADGAEVIKAHRIRVDSLRTTNPKAAAKIARHRPDFASYIVVDGIVPTAALGTRSPDPTGSLGQLSGR